MAAAALAAGAQTSSVTIYGSLDQYSNAMHSSSGATVKSLEDDAHLRSRLGFRGYEDVGDGYAAKFQLEGDFSTAPVSMLRPPR
jgi:predicted porin